MVIGIVGLLLFGLILGIIAIVLSSQAKGEMQRQPDRYSNEGAATAGLVLGIVDLVAGVLFFAVVF